MDAVPTPLIEVNSQNLLFVYNYSALKRSHIMSQHFSGNESSFSFEVKEGSCITAALGPMPRETLTAMVDYGLSDDEISRYFKISSCIVAALRRHFESTADQRSSPTLKAHDTCLKQ